MQAASEFALLIKRVRSGDQDAALTIVRQFEPFIHREIRLRLENQHLREIYDTMDVSQLVLASFFVRTAMGEFDIESPEQLVRLLVTMTRHKVASLARRERRQKRDHRRVLTDQDDQLAAIPGREPTPSSVATGAELIERAMRLLNDEEQAIAELRGKAYSWQQVSDRIGGTAQARRVQFMRAVKRVTYQLGLEDSSSA